MDLIEHFRNARKTITMASGKVIFHEGAPGDVMYVLMSGTVSVVVRGAVVEVAPAGSLLGEMALIDRSPRSATLLTRSECRLVPIDLDDFDLLIRETPAFARHVMEVMATRLRRMNERLDQAYNTDLLAS